jgi:NhaC family Na+:H+ antiporter
VAGDQYIAIVLPGRVYRKAFKERGLDPVNLSRALEDAGTITSPLIPWNTCGAYMAATLGVATSAYLPFALFNLLNPLVAAVMALVGFKILPARPEAGEPKRT